MNSIIKADEKVYTAKITFINYKQGHCWSQASEGAVGPDIFVGTRLEIKQHIERLNEAAVYGEYR